MGLSEGVRSKAIEIVTEAGMPVTTDYVAYHLRVSWNAVKPLLLELALQRKLKAVKTSKGWLFEPPQPEKEAIKI